MYVRETLTAETARLLRIKQACQVYGLGVTSMRKLARESNAVIRYGRCFMIDRDAVDRYLQTLREQQHKQRE